MNPLQIFSQLFVNNSIFGILFERTIASLIQYNFKEKEDEENYLAHLQIR